MCRPVPSDVPRCDDWCRLVMPATGPFAPGLLRGGTPLGPSVSRRRTTADQDVRPASSVPALTAVYRREWPVRGPAGAHFQRRCSLGLNSRKQAMALLCPVGLPR
jgi:hypothetical protein